MIAKNAIKKKSLAKSVTHFVEYCVFRVVVVIVGLWPESQLYWLSDKVASLLYHIGYRKKVIGLNLSSSFPDKTQVEIDTCVRETYRNLSDILIENCYSYFWGVSVLKGRINMVNYADVQQLLTKSSCVLVMGHVGNWEWASGALAMKSPDQIACIYKKIRNPLLDKYIKKKRGLYWGLHYAYHLVEKSNFRRFLVRMRRSESQINHQTCGIILNSDQNPTVNQQSQEIDFLGQKTRFLKGAEVVAQAGSYPLVYVDIRRDHQQRGIYQVTFKHIQERQEKSLTEQWVELLALQIKEDPSAWLWSHNRWKKRETPHLNEKMVETKSKEDAYE